MSDITIVTHRPQIAAAILLAHAAVHDAAQSALDHARHAGQLLIEAKANIEHGHWSPWLAEHVPGIAQTTIRGYMRVARRWAELETGNGVADLPLRDALLLLAEINGRPAVVPTDPLQADARARRSVEAAATVKARETPNRRPGVMTPAASVDAEAFEMPRWADDEIRSRVQTALQPVRDLIEAWPDDQDFALLTHQLQQVRLYIERLAKHHEVSA